MKKTERASRIVVSKDRERERLREREREILSRIDVGKDSKQNGRKFFSFWEIWFMAHVKFLLNVNFSSRVLIFIKRDFNE